MDKILAVVLCVFEYVNVRLQRKFPMCIPTSALEGLQNPVNENI